MFRAVLLCVLTACPFGIETLARRSQAFEKGVVLAPLAARPFELDQVKLLEGPFRHALELQVQSLLAYEPDRLLARFRSEAGLGPKAEPYGGWEAQAIAGHSLGHYLSGCSLLFRATADAPFKERVDHIVRELAEVQQANGGAYLGAFKDGKNIFEEQIAKGDIRSQGFDLNGIWVPLYTHHKVLSGLRDAHHLAGNQQALSVATRFADWLVGILSPLSDDQLQQIMACEHGGINECFADLYADTAEDRYLAMARRLYHQRVLEPLSRGVDILPGLHANTQVPKLVGLCRLYDVTGDRAYLRTARFFWDRVVYHHSYVTGGHCDGEYFGPPDTLRDRLSEHTTETCNVYNMLKLSRRLFEHSADPAVADFMERALLNHILASQHPETGHVIYNLTLQMGGRKHYQSPLFFTCCVGTGMENHQKYGRFIYFHDDAGIYVNQFVASELDWSDRGVKLRQETGFPNEQATALVVQCDRPTPLTLRVRTPRWATSGFRVKLNGELLPVTGVPGGYLAIDREWSDGDRLSIDMPFALRLEPMPDDPNRVAIMYGPMVLAGDLGPADDPAAREPDYVPVLRTEERDPTAWLAPIAGEANAFYIEQVGWPRSVTLRPFYATHDRRYTIYWDMLSEQAWDERQAAREAALKAERELLARSVDFVQPGEMQPERDHNMQGERTSTGRFHGRAFRQAAPDGWFSFDLAVDPQSRQSLCVTYWGDESICREFDVLVGDRKIATQQLHKNSGPRFWDAQYPLDPEWLGGKQRVSVRFQSRGETLVGGVFGVRVLRDKVE